LLWNADFRQEREEMDKETRKVTGVDGSIELLEDRILIRRKGFAAYLAQKSDKEIGLADISAIEFRKAGLTNGYIRFALSNGSSKSGNSLTERANDGDTVWFRLSQQRSFEAFRRSVQDRLPEGET